MLMQPTWANAGCTVMVRLLLLTLKNFGGLRMMFHLKKAAAILVVALSLINGSPAFTQSATPSQKTQINDRELRAFVKTYVETQNIRREYEPSIAKSSDPNRTQRLHKSANEELKDALERNDLTVEQYNRIFARVNNDPPLREKVLKMVEQERMKSTGKQPQAR
jgi:hypothetical protein